MMTAYRLEVDVTDLTDDERANLLATFDEFDVGELLGSHKNDRWVVDRDEFAVDQETLEELVDDLGVTYPKATFDLEVV